MKKRMVAMTLVVCGFLFSGCLNTIKQPDTYMLGDGLRVGEQIYVLRLDILEGACPMQYIMIWKDKHDEIKFTIANFRFFPVHVGNGEGIYQVRWREKNHHFWLSPVSPFFE